MNCNEFEQLLADAWGGELAEYDREAFERHMAKCAACRASFEDGIRALDFVRSLEGPKQVSAKREGDRLILQLPQTEPARTTRAPRGSAFRLAAGILIAFTAGYALHAGLMLRDASQGATRHVGRAQRDALVASDPSEAPFAETQAVLDGPGDTLRSALASAYLRGGRGSDLATCLTVLSDSGS